MATVVEQEQQRAEHAAAPPRWRPSSTAAPPDERRPDTPRRRPQRTPFFSDFTLEKAFVVIGFMVAWVLVGLFALDLAAGWPFWRASTAFDVAAVVCGAGLGWLSWNTYRDMTRR